MIISLEDKKGTEKKKDMELTRKKKKRRERNK